jgi:hypothetical protein
LICSGALSKPFGSEDDLRVVERLAEKLRPYVLDESRPEYYGPPSRYTPKFRIPDNGLRWPWGLENEDTTSEFPILGNQQLGPWKLDNDDFDSFPTNKRLYKMFEKLLEPHFHSFPRGPHTCKYMLEKLKSRMLKCYKLDSNIFRFIDAH